VQLSQYETTHPEIAADFLRSLDPRRYYLGMHGAPSGTGNAGVGPPAEDLDNVLTRFQEWSRKGPSATKSGSPLGIGRSAPSKKVNLAAGARELSYEQALRATSYRRQSYRSPA
jgi:hypothetical protein